MKYILTLILTTILVSTQSCQPTVPNKQKYAEAISTLWNHQFLKNIEYIVIIPQEGCGGCITYAEEFYNEHAENDKLAFVFTNIVSLKAIKNRVKFNAANSMLDTNMLFSGATPKNLQIYPAVIKMKNGEITEIHYQSPDEDALFDLDNHLYQIESE